MAQSKQERINELTEALASVTRELDETLNVTSRAVSQCAGNVASRVSPSQKAITKARAVLAKGRE